jgi:hypothetical protein
VFYAAPLPSLSAKSVPSPIVAIALVSVPSFVSTVLSYAFLPVLIVELALVDTNTVIAVSGGDVYITLSYVVVVVDFLPLIYLALASGNISVGGGESHAHLVQNRSNAELPSLKCYQVLPSYGISTVELIPSS